VSALRFLRGSGLRLSRGDHERDQRVADGALHRVLSGTVKSDAIDHGSDEATLARTPTPKTVRK
jgi:hypothetical protein